MESKAAMSDRPQFINPSNSLRKKVLRDRIKGEGGTLGRQIAGNLQKLTQSNS